jgi:hypothetical protein
VSGPVNAWGAAGFARRGPSRGVRDPLRVPHTMPGATAAEDAMEMLPCLALSPNPEDKKAFETARKRKGGQ